MPKKDYHNWSKDKLVHELKELGKLEKSFGMVWKEKFEPEQVIEKCKDFLPVLKKEKTRKQIITGSENINHIFIEADNYHALSVLNYTHKRKVDVIFIDPPYNLNKFYSEYKDNRRVDEYINWCNKWLSECIRVLKPSGSLFVINIPKF